MRYLIDAIRGFLMGSAEVVPGISGGTVAILVGVYESLIRSADHLVRGVVYAARDLIGRRGMARAADQFRHVELRLLVPLGIGMVSAVLIGSALIAPVIESHPIESRAVMLGLMIVSLVVPVRAVGSRWRGSEVLLALAAAVAAFLFTGLPANDPIDPPLIVVGLVAAVAICALVLPGMSGSFVLLVLGLYTPTLAAVNERDLAYLGVFMLGAVLGLATFVSGIRWLLEHHHRITFVLASGLMAGSLRALWPWQAGDRTLQAPDDRLLPVALLVLLGAAIVGAILLGEHAAHRRTARAAALQDAATR